VQRIIYLQPIGSFTPAEWSVVEFAANYIKLFFGLKTILSPVIADSIIPKDARRNNEYGHQQLNSLYMIDSLLVKTIPSDGIVLMAITAKDLYPSEKWNYVFGQADLKKRVGVSSIYRLHDWPLTATNYQLCLNRLIKTSTHEIGHMFSVRHCINTPCLMNGSNSLTEADKQPTHLCAECLKKLYWNLKFNLAERNNQLINFFKTHQLTEDLGYYQRSAEILEE
jgi:archaemetzincin